MHPKKNPTDAYRRTEVMTSNKETILLMLYAGAIRSLKKAIEAGEANDFATAGPHIMKVQEIVTELCATLNFEKGGELAHTLQGLYLFILQRLVTANIERKVEPLHASLKILSNLNEAWEQAVEQLRK